MSWRAYQEKGAGVFCEGTLTAKATRACWIATGQLIIPHRKDAKKAVILFLGDVLAKLHEAALKDAVLRADLIDMVKSLEDVA